jgi:uncharacterized tellurite resistance protein B-like protein
VTDESRMLKTLKDLFESFAPAPAGAAAAHDEHQLRLATAVLLVEVMRSDHVLAEAEQDAVREALQVRFDLSRDESERLVELAHGSARVANDYFAFTSRINAAFEMDEKIRIVELMWQVAYADGRLDAHEQHVMRRLADLLHVPHGAYVHAKMRAAAAAAAAQGPLSAGST